jgi:glucose-6-phosphate isomerase
VEKDFNGKHICAVSTNLEATSKFGILNENVFGFWDWVGGRFSVCSAVGALPLSLAYGYDVVRKFLDGANFMDTHFRNTTTVSHNLPVLLGLIGVYNAQICEFNTRAILPYCQGLLRFPAHVQQLDMESNGKSANLEGNLIDFDAGAINFGEPGTNSQHSFFQLMHQGRTIPGEFIGFV